MSYVDKLLSENEEIVHVSRQHWTVMVFSLVSMVIVALLILSVSRAVFFLSAGSLLRPVLVLLALLIVPVGKVLIDWLRWRNRMLVVTSRRVIHLQGVLNKNVLDSSLEKVNDVGMAQNVFGRIFDYGDLEILTASETGANRFERVSHPVCCKMAMLDQKTLLDANPAVAADIPRQIGKLAVRREKGILSDAEFVAKKTDLLNRL